MRGQLHQPLFRFLRNGEFGDEGVQRFPGDAALAAGEFLELLVGVFHAVAAHHGLDGFRQHFPVVVQVFIQALRVGFQLAGNPDTAF